MKATAYFYDNYGLQGTSIAGLLWPLSFVLFYFMFHKKIPSKLKKQAIRILLSSKLKDGKLKIVDKLEFKNIKTKEAQGKFDKMGIKSATFIEVGDINKNFLLSTRNLKNIDFLSVNGLNAYQIIKRDDLVVSLSAVKEVVKRYGNE